MQKSWLDMGVAPLLPLDTSGVVLVSSLVMSLVMSLSASLHCVWRSFTSFPSFSIAFPLLSFLLSSFSLFVGVGFLLGFFQLLFALAYSDRLSRFLGLALSLDQINS